VLVEGAFTNLEVLWDVAEYRTYCEQLASFSRLIIFDKRGMGLSDRVRIGTLEERMDDVRAIMDDASSESAVLMGVSEGGPMSMLFAATYPERTQALVLCGAEVKEETTEDWPWGESTREEIEEHLTIENTLERWGKGLAIAYIAPSRKHDERLRELFGRLQVQSASPHDAVAFMRMAHEIDVRHVAPSINTPTLIVHRTADQVCHVENARWLARNIRGAKYVELSGIDHVPWIDGDDVMGEVREFLTGVREPEEPDRVLATVLFTDLVGSTEHAQQLSSATTRSCVTTWPASAVVRSTPPATVSSRRSTVPRARSGAHGRSSTTCATSVSTCASGCTPVKSSSQATTSAALPCTPAHG
jgi:pimeloyl-ACP methyl ester carboxylesterase